MFSKLNENGIAIIYDIVASATVTMNIHLDVSLFYHSVSISEE